MTVWESENNDSLPSLYFQVMADNEQYIARKAGRGDRGAMKALYTSYAGYLAGVCSRYVVTTDDVREILQESFLKIFSSISDFSYRGPGSLRGWMSRIVVNESLAFLKTRLRFDHDDTKEYEESVAEPDEELSMVSDSELHRLIRCLPDGYRTVLNLYVFEEKSHNEIAEILGISPRTSASQFHRAKQTLAKMIHKSITNKRH